MESAHWLRTDPPQVIAHRGDSAHAPENTLIAADRAFQGGADAWELDVQMSRDGVPIVIHDDSLIRYNRRCPTVRGRPEGGRRLPRRRLRLERHPDARRRLVVSPRRRPTPIGPIFRNDGSDFGHPFDLSSKNGGVRIPTLRECLAWTVARGWRVNVELKAFPPPSRRAGRGRVERDRGNRRILARLDLVVPITTSFSKSPGKRPDLPTAALSVTPRSATPSATCERSSAPTPITPSAAALGAESFSYRRHPHPQSLRGETVAELSKAGVPTFVYTVDDASPGGLAESLFALGVAGLFTPTIPRPSAPFSTERSSLFHDLPAD